MRENARKPLPRVKAVKAAESASDAAYSAATAESAAAVAAAEAAKAAAAVLPESGLVEAAKAAAKAAAVAAADAADAADAAFAADAAADAAAESGDAAKAAKAAAKAAKAAKAAAAAAESAKSAAADAITYRTATRDADTVAACRTNYGAFSDRDSAFLFFFGGVMRPRGDSATLAEIHAAGIDAGGGKRRNPYYAGSAKATDAGAINRLIKAGFLSATDNGNRLFATDRARADSRYLGTRKPV
jgi:hypothetical protein